MKLFICLFLLCLGAVFSLCMIERCHRAHSRFTRANQKKALSQVVACFLIASCVLTSLAFAVNADTVPTDSDDHPDINDDTFTSADFDVDAEAAVLMEASTGKILYEKNPDEALPPASVTKIMTLLLVMEALDNGTVKLDDIVNVSGYAASMGGSQVFLEEGEQMKLEDLLKCTVIASANDAAVALAEYLAGSEEAFVKKMNDRAAELGANNSKFENVTGLDDDTVEHVMSAKDIALISKELVSHKKILEYSSVWMDTIRDGAFTLTNTNRLIRYYKGATGLKTGSTDKAKFCITATAERDGMSLIAVIMAAPTRDIRNACAKTLFDWGFANYALYTDDSFNADDVPVLYGKKDVLKTRADDFSAVVKKSEISKIKRVVSMASHVNAGVNKGDIVGTVSYMVDDVVIGCSHVRACYDIERLNYFSIVGRMIKIFVLS